MSGWPTNWTGSTLLVRGCYRQLSRTPGITDQVLTGSASSDLDRCGAFAFASTAYRIQSCKPMAIPDGTRLGPYEVLAPIGAGGMGEVYKGRDTRLDRTVAIKVSSGEFSERFQREAHAIASLNHPHICTLHD